ncbi:MAG: SDR family NAD(P)-dependent oxidoreductase, partial [Planctomycetota bacterium]
MPSSRSKLKPKPRKLDSSSPLAELIEISRAIGADTDLVQGGGGNTSVTDRAGKRLFVKASGTALADMSESAGWSELDLSACLDILSDERLKAVKNVQEREAHVLGVLDRCVVKPRGSRPSVESCLHALLGRVVIHTHPVGLNALLCSKDSRDLWTSAVKGLEKKALYIPYVDPGYTLAAFFAKELATFEAERGHKPSVVVLENHGLFVAADEVDECLALSKRVTQAGKRWLGRGAINPSQFDTTLELSKKQLKAIANNGAGVQEKQNLESLVNVRGALIHGGSAPVLVRRDDSDEATDFLGDATLIATAKKGAFTPDQIVYCRTKPLVLTGKAASWKAAVTKYREKAGLDPRVVIVPTGASAGVYYAAPTLAEVKTISEVYRSAIAALLASKTAGGARLLSAAQTRFIENWEVEAFRAALQAGKAKPLSGRVALVTGAGSGLGKGIAMGLLEAGATIVGLDVDEDGVKGVAAEQPFGRFLGLRCDVTSEDSVQAAFDTAVRSLGGIDFLVNAAGIAPSFNLVDFPLGAWNKTLEINLTGYFLTARAAARVLLQQGIGGGMVNLTSKSGLDASKANSAYNATKSGEIHLMRGWAMELGPAGIRVNCVAPGNVFKGSKIWNDEYIKICARKKGIRPEEVIPYYTSLSPLGQ